MEKRDSEQIFSMSVTLNVKLLTISIMNHFHHHNFNTECED